MTDDERLPALLTAVVYGWAVAVVQVARLICIWVREYMKGFSL